MQQFHQKINQGTSSSLSYMGLLFETVTLLAEVISADKSFLIKMLKFY
jgi:hypothetical protein